MFAADRPNVVLIIADDLRPQLGCYGDRTVKTPHIDAFAQRALRFDRAYVQCAICSPSRNSFLSGLRPETTGLRGFGRTLRETVPDVVTLPQHFKNHGYHAAGFGKIFHIYAETMRGSEDDPASWSQPIALPQRPVWGPEQEKVRERRTAEAIAAGRKLLRPHDWPFAAAVESADVADDALQDGETATAAIAFLRARAVRRDEPFFLAVGFFKPHLPYVAPKKYFDLYDPVRLSLPADPKPPRDAPAWSLVYGIDRAYADAVPEAQATEAYRRRQLHGYLASISYMDACAGRVFDALDATGLTDRTIVVLIGDNGYQMGEHGNWNAKHSNYETSTRVPLLVAAPGHRAGGQATSAFVELVDLYPTLAELAGLPPPARSEGASFVPLLDAPGQPWKTTAFSEIQRADKLGRTLRTDRYRYVEWTDRQGKIVARELYDHSEDAPESVNLAARPERAAVVTELSARLGAGWTAARPVQSGVRGAF